MSTVKSKSLTSKLIIEERIDGAYLHYTLMILGIVCAFCAMMALLTAVVGVVIPMGLSVVLAIPFALLYGIWKDKLVKHNAKRLLAELQIDAERVVRTD